MSFVVARCPQCGGEIQVDNQQDTGFCLHCGSKIIVQEAIRAVRIDNSHMVDSWLRMGKAALEAGNYSEAYDYFTRVVEIKPDDWFALLQKGYSASLQSSFEKPRIDELMHGIKQAIKLIDATDMNVQEKTAAKNLIPPRIIYSYVSYIAKVKEFVKETDFRWMRDDDLMKDIRGVYEKSIQDYQLVLEELVGLEDQISKNNRLSLIIEVMDQCANVCWPFMYYKDNAKTESYYYGYSVTEKKRFVNLYDDLYIQGLYEDPGFKPKMEEALIDRLSPPSDIELGYEHEFNYDAELNELITSMNKSLAFANTLLRHDKLMREEETKAANVRKLRLEENKKQIYWKEHPEEYHEYLDQETKKNKEREAKLVNLQSQKNKNSARVNEIENEIRSLHSERSKLGMFNSKEKKVIDENVARLQADLNTIKSEIANIDKEIVKISKTN